MASRSGGGPKIQIGGRPKPGPWNEFNKPKIKKEPVFKKSPEGQKLKTKNLKDLQTASQNIEIRIDVLNLKYDMLREALVTLKDTILPELLEISERKDVPLDVKILILKQIIIMEKF